jgi:hypothetical protein
VTAPAILAPIFRKREPTPDFPPARSEHLRRTHPAKESQLQAA